MSSRIKVLVTKKQAKKLEDGKRGIILQIRRSKGEPLLRYSTVRRCMIWNWNVSRTSPQITPTSMAGPLNDLQMRSTKKRSGL